MHLPANGFTGSLGGSLIASDFYTVQNDVSSGVLTLHRQHRNTNNSAITTNTCVTLSFMIWHYEMDVPGLSVVFHFVLVIDAWQVLLGLDQTAVLQTRVYKRL